LNDDISDYSAEHGVKSYMRTTLSKANMHQRMTTLDSGEKLRDPYTGEKEIKRVEYSKEGKTGIKVTKHNHL
jgi:hypothetical protein